MTDLNYFHGGNLRVLAEKAHCSPSDLLDFSINLNPFGPPPGLFQAYFHAFDAISPYPDPHGERLCEQLEQTRGLESGSVLAGNGAGEILSLIPKIFSFKRAVIPVPAYLEYERVCRMEKMEILRYPLLPENDFLLNLQAFEQILKEGDLVFLGNPCNPSGRCIKA